MVSVCGFRLGRYCTCHVRLDSHHRVSRHAPVIRRSIWSNLVYFPGPAAGHMYIPELLCLYLYDEEVWAGVQFEFPFCLGHVVVGQLRYELMVWAQVPHRRIGVSVYAAGNFWLGARGRTPWLTGH